MAKKTRFIELGTYDMLAQIEHDALVEIYGVEEGERIFERFQNGEFDDADNSLDLSEDELDKAIDEEADEEYKAFLEEEALTDEEIREKYGEFELGEPEEI